MSMTQRTMRVLELLAAAPQGLRVTDLAQELDLNRAIPFRILSDLAEMGYVVKDPLSERYRATFSLGGLGLRQIEESGVQDWAQSELDTMAMATRELVRLAICDQDRLQFVCRAQGSNSALLIVDSSAGADVALHATASGKAWLSTLDDIAVEKLLAKRGLVKYTDMTPGNLSTIVRDLDEVRRVGYSLIHEEMEPGVSAIAAPIIPPESVDGVAVATVSIAGPTVRVRETLESFAPDLLASASRLANSWRVREYLEYARRPLVTQPT